jgi:copper(I)-binding protein
VRVVALLFCVLAGSILSGCDKAGEEPDFTLSNLVIREMPPGKDVGVAYLTLENHSRNALVFNYIHSPRASSIEVHQHVHEDGKMMMREVKHFSVAPNSRIDFVPRGYHLMLFGVTERFEDGEKVELTFEFEDQTPITVLADVKKR